MLQNVSLPRALSLAALLFPLAGPALRAQDFEGTLTARMRGTPGGGEMKIYLKEGKYRMEMTAPGQGQVAIIADPAKGETYMVMPAQSMYMVIKMSEVERMADSVVRKHSLNTDVSVTATGKIEEIAGHHCEVYRFRGETGGADICFATGIGGFNAGAGLFSGPPMPGHQRPMPPWAQALFKKGAFPLRVSDTTGVMLWEVTSLEAKSLDAALFTPPADYRRMEMPGFGRPPGS